MILFFLIIRQGMFLRVLFWNEDILVMMLDALVSTVHKYIYVLWYDVYKGCFVYLFLVMKFSVFGR